MLHTPWLVCNSKDLRARCTARCAHIQSLLPKHPIWEGQWHCSLGPLREPVWPQEGHSIEGQTGARCLLYLVGFEFTAALSCIVVSFWTTRQVLLYHVSRWSVMKPVFLNLPYSSGITCYYSFKFYLNLNSGVLKQHLVSHQLLCFFIIFLLSGHLVRV